MFGSSNRRRAWLAAPIALATAFAVAVPLANSASAAHVGAVVLSPDADSASVGTCNQFTAELRSPAGAPVDDTVDVILAENPSSPTQQVTFCSLSNNDPDNPVTPEAAANASTFGGGAGTQGEFKTGTDGKVVFGVQATEAGRVDVTAYYDADNDNNLDADELREVSVKTFTAGGTANARSITASPKNDTNAIGETHTVTATVRNTQGDTLPGVEVSFNVTGANPRTNTVCGTTNQAGRVNCTYTGTNVGNDTITVYANQTNADNNVTTPDTAGPDAGEPSDTAQKTYVQALTGLIVDLTCASPTTASDVCENPLTETTEVFTATVTSADGPDADTTRDPAAGVLVRFTVADPGTQTGTSPESNPDATVNPTSCTTDSTGKCTTTLTKSNPSSTSNPANPQANPIVVTATVAGQNAGADAANVQKTSDTASKAFRQATGAEARFINLTPPTANTAPGAFRTFTATVTDRFGNPVRNVEVTFTEDGPGRFTSGQTSVVSTTDASGVATAEVTSGTSESGTQTITATITSPRTTGANNDNCEAAAAGSTAAGNCVDTSTNQIGGTASPTPSATASTPAPTGSATPGPGCQNGTPFAVTLRSNVTQITAGNAPTLSGTVLNSANQPCASTNVTIFKKSFGEAAYTAVATVTTNAQGTFTLVVRPLVQTAYGANVSDSVRSNIVNIRVYTRVNIVSPRTTAAPGSTPVGNPVTFTGNLFPGYSNIAVGLGTLINGRFNVLQQTRSNSSGGWSITRTLPRGTGVYVIFVSAVSQGSDKGSKSITITVS